MKVAFLQIDQFAWVDIEWFLSTLLGGFCTIWHFLNVRILLVFYKFMELVRELFILLLEVFYCLELVVYFLVLVIKLPENFVDFSIFLFKFGVFFVKLLLDFLKKGLLARFGFIFELKILILLYNLLDFA